MFQFIVTVIVAAAVGGGFFASATGGVCPPNCSSGYCDSKGICKSCKDSFWGPTCEKKCPAHCEYTRCNMTDGTCSGCAQSMYWRPVCENPCPPHCFPGGQCKFKDGTCNSCSTPNWEHMPTCDLPGGCLSPKGTDCNYYDKCLNSLHDCPEVTSVMKPKCDEYLALESKLSKNSTAWSKTTRQCIQKKISDKVLNPQGASFSCDDVSTTFYDEHIDCYLNGGAVSFCSLPPVDKLTIVAHGLSIFRSDPKRIWKVLPTGGKLLISCSNQQLYSGVFSSSPGLWSNLEVQIKKQVALRGWDYASQPNAYASTAFFDQQKRDRRVSVDSAADMQLGIFGTEASTLVTAESVLEAVLAAVKAVEVPADAVLLYNDESLI